MSGQRCNPQLLNTLENTNWNKLHGNGPMDIINLSLFAECFNSKERFETKADIMLGQNKAFVQAILTHIYAKNKLDYPPVGPMDPTKQEYQSLKIQRIIQAIINTYAYQFGSLDLVNMTESGVHTAAAWGMNTARGINRTVSQPRQTASNTGTSIKRMFGWNKGGRHRHRKNGRRISRKL